MYLFLTLWFVNLGYRDTEILKCINPLATPAVTIRVGTREQPANASASDSNKKTLHRIGTALMGMLRAEYEHKNITINGIPAHQVTTHLRAQINMYAEGKYPFDRIFGDDDEPMAWWQSLSQHPDAQILAVRVIYHSILSCTHLPSSTLQLNSSP